MNRDFHTPAWLDCDPGHDDAVTMAVEPDDVTKIRGTSVVDSFDRLPERASNVSVAIELGDGRYLALALTLSSLDSLGSA